MENGRQIHIDILNSGIGSWNEAGLVKRVLKGGTNLNDIGTPRGNTFYSQADVWSQDMDELLKYAKDGETFSYVTRKIEDAIDNNLNVPVVDYQIKATKKMNELGIDYEVHE